MSIDRRQFFGLAPGVFGALAFRPREKEISSEVDGEWPEASLELVGAKLAGVDKKIVETLAGQKELETRLWRLPGMKDFSKMNGYLMVFRQGDIGEDGALRASRKPGGMMILLVPEGIEGKPLEKEHEFVFRFGEITVGAENSNGWSQFDLDNAKWFVKNTEVEGVGIWERDISIGEYGLLEDSPTLRMTSVSLVKGVPMIIKGEEGWRISKEMALQHIDDNQETSQFVELPTDVAKQGPINKEFLVAACGIMKIVKGATREPFTSLVMEEYFDGWQSYNKPEILDRQTRLRSDLWIYQQAKLKYENDDWEEIQKLLQFIRESQPKRRPQVNDLGYASLVQNLRMPEIIARLHMGADWSKGTSIDWNIGKIDVYEPGFAVDLQILPGLGLIIPWLEVEAELETRLVKVGMGGVLQG